jgi:bifunctional non-homologous end joining protein LigD
MALEEYKRKRDFRATPEPEGRVKKSKGSSFVIQKHAASRLHYDFRLEMEGVLRSWAVPKGPSLDPGEKRLAVHVEDHPIEYGDFEGTIPQGQYGGGTVLLWDRGTWTPDGDPVAGYTKGHLRFALDGDKLQGGWDLVRLGGRRRDDGDDNWLLIKVNDDAAEPGSGDAIVRERPESVASGKSLEEIAADPEDVWQTSRPARRADPFKVKLAALAAEKRRSAGAAPQSAVDPSAIPKARKAAMPSAIEPQLATLVAEVPRGDDWLHEIKYDGYRVLCEIRGGEARILNRHGQDWTERFARLAREAATLPVAEAVLDGEIVVLQADGTTSFQALQNALDANRQDDLVCFVFDLLYLDGWDLRRAPLLARKEALAGILDGSRGSVRLSDHVAGGGEDFFRHACSFGLAGIISKRAGLGYRSGRSKDWLTVQCTAGAGLEAPAKRTAKKKKAPKRSGAKGSKPAIRPAPEEAAVARGRSRDREVEIAGVRFTNPDKVLYPENGLTKRDIAVFYSRIADWILPHLAERPLTLVRCPDGRTRPCFYQKHINEHLPDSVHRVDVGEAEPYGAVSDLDGLLALVQMGVLEVHIWGGHRDRIEQPDYVVFDLDPDDGLPWERVVEAALMMRDFLGELGLETFLKTTGGKGLHVVFPLERRDGWDEVKAFTKAVADTVAGVHPGRYTSNLSKASRRGKVFIDYLRNGRGATSICPYSTRAREGATVSTPLFWDELELDVRGDTFNVHSLPARLEGLPADPWAGFNRFRQSITAAMKKAVGMR